MLGRHDQRFHTSVERAVVFDCVVREHQRQSFRVVEARTRDRVSEARAGVQRWIDESERRAADAVAEALEILTCDPEASQGASGEAP